MWQVIGHPKALESIKRSIVAERLAHAYLITGPPHVGKTTLAINLAQALNCEQEHPPCGQCNICTRIAAGNHPDIQFIGRFGDNGSNTKKEISINQIRELQQAASLRPYEGKYRIFIVDGAEHMNEESANCLLKTLEEPPADVFIILLTADKTNLLPTIISRCHPIELLPINPLLIEQALIDQWQVDSEKAKHLSRLSRGGIGWAINASCDDSVLNERFAKLTGLMDLITSSLDQRFEYAANLALQFTKKRSTVEEILNLWLEWWRDLLLVKAECPQLVVNIDQLTVLQQQASAYGLNEIRNFIEAILSAMEQLEQNANPRLVLEVLMLSIPRKTEPQIKLHTR